MSSSALTVDVRPMTAEDVDWVMEIAAGLPNSPHWPRGVWIDAINPGAVLRRVALVAVPGRIEQALAATDRRLPAIFGFAVASLLPPQAELEAIAVVAEHQRLGLGCRLLTELVEQLSQTGIEEILLEVRTSNLAAIGLYRGFGFNQIGVRAGYYADPVEDAVLMNLRPGQVENFVYDVPRS